MTKKKPKTTLKKKGAVLSPSPAEGYQNGKTAYDLAWLLYKEITMIYPQEFEKPFDHHWWLSKCMESVTLQMKEGERIQSMALAGIDSGKARN
jgi:hypothetical protein